MERRIIDFAGAHVQLEQRVGTDPPLIVGLGSVFYQKDDPGTEYLLWEYAGDRCLERVMPTAFDEVLKAGMDVAGLFNHDPSALLGRTTAGTMKLEKTAAGLLYTITPPDSPLARSVIESIRRGDLRGSSFSFTATQEGQRWIRQGKTCVREIHSVSRLYDCGPVTFAAYDATSTGTRSAGPDDEARQAFEAWQAADRKRAVLAQTEARARCVRLGL
jgi:HK97 family phage prohead protease